MGQPEQVDYFSGFMYPWVWHGSSVNTLVELKPSGIGKCGHLGEIVQPGIALATPFPTTLTNG